MAKNNIKKQPALTEEERQERVIEQVSRTEEFFNKYKTVIWGVLAAILVIALCILAYTKFYAQPKKAEAMQQTYPAEANFRAEEYDLALNGDGNVLGFSQIIDEYGSKAGKAVYLYAGICEFHLGNYDKAISYLKKYDSKDNIMAARGLACIGDCYLGLEDFKSAIPWFEKAAERSDNLYSATYLLKAGTACEETGDNQKALTYYKKIKDQYPQSMEGYEIDKYISRIEGQQK